MTTIDEFEDDLARWGRLVPGHRMPAEDVARLITLARGAGMAAWTSWSALHAALVAHGGHTRRDADTVLRDLRIRADLGCPPKAPKKSSRRSSPGAATRSATTDRGP